MCFFVRELVHHIVRLAADAPRVQPGIFLQLVIGLGSKGHGAMQVRNENTLFPGSKCGVVQNQDSNSNQSASLYKKQRSKIPFFVLAHSFFLSSWGQLEKKE